MTGFELILILLAASAALQVMAWRWHLPRPVLLVLGGAALALTPGIPTLQLNPDVVFLAFVPPLLYWTAFTTSLRDFTLAFGPIARLGIVLVLVTIGAVAVTAHALTPRFTWAAAFALAAIVAPPDAIAATAVMRPLGAPSRLVSILEGEGLVNDATALVALRVATAAAVTGRFSPTQAVVSVLITGVGGIAVGLMVGSGIMWLRTRIVGLTVVENTVSLLTPFAAYIPADFFGASGVLATVTVGLYLGRMAPHIVGASTRLQAEAMWTMIVFLLESLIFILTGLELPRAFQALGEYTLGTLLWYGFSVSGVVILVRLLWIFPSAYLPRLLISHGGAGRRRPQLPSWQSVAFVGWAGMRGGDSFVFALALPLTAAGGRFPVRDLIIFITFAVIVATLVLQGLTLRPLLLRLGLHDSGPKDMSEETRARRIVAEVGRRRFDKLASGRDAESDSVRHRQGRIGTIDAQRRALIELRDRGVIGDDVMRRVQRDLDLETMLMEGAEGRTPPSSLANAERHRAPSKGEDKESSSRG